MSSSIGVSSKCCLIRAYVPNVPHLSLPLLIHNRVNIISSVTLLYATCIVFDFLYINILLQTPPLKLHLQLMMLKCLFPSCLIYPRSSFLTIANIIPSDSLIYLLLVKYCISFFLDIKPLLQIQFYLC